MGKNGTKFEGATTQALIDLAKDIAEMKSMLISYEKRISTLERWRWLLSGAIVTLVASRFPALTHLLNIQ